MVNLDAPDKTNEHESSSQIGWDGIDVPSRFGQLFSAVDQTPNRKYQPENPRSPQPGQGTGHEAAQLARRRRPQQVPARHFQMSATGDSTSNFACFSSERSFFGALRDS